MCAACGEFDPGSPIIRGVQAGGPYEPDITYTNIATVHDEAVAVSTNVAARRDPASPASGGTVHRFTVLTRSHEAPPRRAERPSIGEWKRGAIFLQTVQMDTNMPTACGNVSAAACIFDAEP